MKPKIKFLDKFPHVDYIVENQLLTMTDLTREIVFTDVANTLRYRKFYVREGARPDQISQLLYGDPQFYWLFFIVNPHLRPGLKAWPKSDEEFDAMMEREYGNIMLLSDVFGLDSEFTPLHKLGLDYDRLDEYRIMTESEGEWTETDLRFLQHSSEFDGYLLSRGDDADDYSMFNLTHPAVEDIVGSKKQILYVKGPEGAFDEFPGTINGEGFAQVYYNPDMSAVEFANAQYHFGDDARLPLTYLDVKSDLFNNDGFTKTGETLAQYLYVLNDAARYINVPIKEAVIDISRRYFNLINS